jgi:hypothetical protein
MSPATVHSHLAHVRAKLRVRRTGQAAVAAYERGLLNRKAMAVRPPREGPGAW